MGTWASRERRGFTNQGLTLSVRPKSEMALGFRKGQILLKGRRGVPIAGLVIGTAHQSITRSGELEKMADYKYLNPKSM